MAPSGSPRGRGADRDRAPALGAGKVIRVVLADALAPVLLPDKPSISPPGSFNTAPEEMTPGVSPSLFPGLLNAAPVSLETTAGIAQSVPLAFAWKGFGSISEAVVTAAAAT